MPASHCPPRRSAISVQLMAQFGLDQGLSIDACLAGTDLSWQLLADPGAEVAADQELQLIRNLVQGLGDRPGIGLLAGRRYQLNTYGIWGFALLSSPTYRDAVLLGLRYLDLTYAFHGMRIEEHGEEVHLLLDDQHIPADLQPFILDRDLAGMLTVQRELLNREVLIQRMDLRQSAPADTQPYLREFGLLPNFAQAENRLVFERYLLDLPLPGANPSTASLCEAQCQQLLDKRRRRDGLAGQIRNQLLSRPGRLADMEEVADGLHMSSRTLRRRLEEENTNFRLLLEEVRQALAEELLAMGGLTLEQVAERLGYGEVSNFIHAFKRWKGVTPRQYQRS
ncbi:AraC family transcriptional regulator [Aquipseudomonas ullengensis]|uniref:AraC family transcriptional regulator n=1 Tax=Aquipseudomonas ullengensis TaxID=2759166 RepID=A0A7W4LMM5_9GAMM|nr:AraC family transcriptional regulator [Pseudomonas ullengensis]MBB2495832.1 AraC family transcriptional regulator [Pseudomonas ullengensis]